VRVRVRVRVRVEREKEWKERRVRGKEKRGRGRKKCLFLFHSLISYSPLYPFVEFLVYTMTNPADERQARHDTIGISHANAMKTHLPDWTSSRPVRENPANHSIWKVSLASNCFLVARSRFARLSEFYQNNVSLLYPLLFYFYSWLFCYCVLSFGIIITSYLFISISITFSRYDYKRHTFGGIREKWPIEQNGRSRTC
jgi:hypothetical protein